MITTRADTSRYADIQYPHLELAEDSRGRVSIAAWKPSPAKS